MEIGYKIFYKQELEGRKILENTENDRYNLEYKCKKLLETYNYNSTIVLHFSDYYLCYIPDNIINIISEHDILVIVGNCLVKLDNIPNNVKLINIANKLLYTYPLNNLPSELEHLIIDTRYYGNSLDYLPASLKSLLLNCDCDIPLNNLPSGLEYLLVGGRYNEPLDNLPRNLKVLILSEFYQKPLINLPPGLRELYIGCDYYLPITNLPDSIEYLTISGKPQSIELPRNLKIFTIGFEASYFVKLVDSIEEINLNILSLKILYNLLVHYCPLKLKTIKIQPLMKNLQDFEQDIIDEIKYNCPEIDIQIKNTI